MSAKLKVQTSKVTPISGDFCVPTYSERALHLLQPAEAFDQLEDVDWSFTDDDTRFLAHDLHPYPAKFIPQLPGTIVALMSSRGDLVFDPFGGSGTTALEAVRLGRRAVSFDANPVAALIGKVKTARMTRESEVELRRLHGALRAQLSSLPADPTVFVGQYERFAPTIVNRGKWFPDSSYGELAHIKSRISLLESESARDIALLALSRSVLGSSFQDSETRYKSVPREIPVGETTKRYLREFEAVLKSVVSNSAATRYGVSKFMTGDVRDIPLDDFPEGSVDLVVTSPPYGNAMDYHLYHRFRLLWLGHDPVEFGKIEIGSHLKHQREASGFETYFADMLKVLEGISRVLKHGRYAALVIGDSVYGGKTYDTARLLADKSNDLGFDNFRVIDREVHKTKRSFTPAGRRAAKESILILRKTAKNSSTLLEPPPYKLWPYEEKLRDREIASKISHSAKPKSRRLSLDAGSLTKCRSLVFTHQIQLPSGYKEPTWQSILENGMATNPAARKDPKYVTHGIHSYKGKFYPQLAKGLINQKDLPYGATILDPFCGSGTTLLEGYLNGYLTRGCDLNPLAAKIATAKTAILVEPPDVVSEVVKGILDSLETAPSSFPVELDQFQSDCLEEIAKWFANPVAQKINWLLRIIRSGSAGSIRDFLEVILSSVTRDVSQQEPSDLRIRYRKELLTDADVIGAFKQQLLTQFARIEKFWQIRGYAPNPFYPAVAIPGDNRSLETYDELGLSECSVDLVLTSPPYAMALPYIDTDRLSLLTLFGLGGTKRRPIEKSLIGSREITNRDKQCLEEEFLNDASLPPHSLEFIRSLHKAVSRSSDAGFRKRNMPALTHRFLKDMDAVFNNLHRLCKNDAEAMIVIGDSKMTIDGKNIRIPTTDLCESIALANGFASIERIDISVTTENLLHIKNAITENVVLRLKKR